MKAKVEFLHSWYLLGISLLGLLFLLISTYWISSLCLVVVLHYFYFNNGLTLKAFKKNVFAAFLFSFFIVALYLLWPAESLNYPPFVKIGEWSVAQSVLEAGAMRGIKLFLLILTSMASARVINYTKVILYFIIHKGLKVIWGYPIMIALNSILLFKEEYERIQLNGKLRDLGWMGKLGVLFSLLVFAIRHSQRGSLSLVTRGLNPHKSFYFSYQLYPHDKNRFRSFLTFYFALLLLTLAFHFYFR